MTDPYINTSREVIGLVIVVPIQLCICAVVTMRLYRGESVNLLALGGIVIVGALIFIGQTIVSLRASKAGLEVKAHKEQGEDGE